MRTPTTASARCAELGLPGVLRPLVDEPSRDFACVDLETTGTDTARDRIVSIAIVLLGPDGSEEERWSRIVDPGVPIPPAVSRIHGITDESAFGLVSTPRR